MDGSVEMEETKEERIYGFWNNFSLKRSPKS